jgi:hypothetical protein
MPDTPTPWVGLVALAAMFLLPSLPDWLFEGPRTSKHWLRRHSCGDCGAPGPTSTVAPPGRARPARSFVASWADFPGLFTAPGLQSTRQARRVSRPGARSAHSAESDRSVSQRRLGAHVR